jgi:hypothetical protein
MSSRRRRQEEEESDEDVPAPSTQRRRRAPVSDDESEEEAELDNGDNMEVAEDDDSIDQVVKKLVRYALACEYQRLPIKRVGIAEKSTPSILPLYSGPKSDCYESNVHSNGKTTSTIQTSLRSCAEAASVCLWYGDGGVTEE